VAHPEYEWKNECDMNNR